MDSTSRLCFIPTQRSSTIGRFSRATFTPVGHDKIYVWGAREQGENFAVLNLKNREWSIRESAHSEWPSPGVRHAHTATHYAYDGRSHIVIYGGYGDEMHEPVTTHIFDVENGRWLEGPTPEGFDDYAPAARSFHSATYVCVDNEPYLFVVGGLHMRANDHSRDRNWAPPELCVLNLRTRKWYSSINVPSRYGHAAVFIPGSRPRIFILGGRDARGKYSSLHFVIDVLAVLDWLKIHDKSFHSSAENPPLPGDVTSALQSCPWHSLGPNSIGSFNGTSNLWADRISNVVYIFGQNKGDSGAPTDMFPNASGQTLPYSMWILRFDAGWSTFDDISTHILPLPSGVGDTDRRERWLWFGVLDSGLKITRGDDPDEIDWNQVPTEPILFALNSACEPSLGISPEESSKNTIRCFAVPALALPATVVESHNDDRPRYGDGWYSPSYTKHLPPLWHPTQRSPELSLSLPPTASRPDFAIQSSTHGAPPILAHSIIIGARSSYFRMLLNNDFRSQTTEGYSADTYLKTTVDESYLTIYSLVYFLYCNALPPFLVNRSARKRAEQKIHPLHLPQPSPASPWESWARSVDPVKVASDLLIAADKYLFPPSLSDLLRRCIMENYISPSTSVFFWRATYLTRNQSDAGAETVLMVENTRNENGSVKNYSLVRRNEEGWLERIVREAYERQESRPDLPARAFLAEISRWCARRIDEIEPVVQVLSEDSSNDTEGQGEDEGNAYAVESEIVEAFWEEMRKMGASRTEFSQQQGE